MTEIPEIIIEKNISLPLIGLGTWELRGEECVKSVRLALDLGYRHFDTAHSYERTRASKRFP